MGGSSMLGVAGATWGVLGVAAVFAGGVISLGHRALTLWDHELSSLQWILLALWLVFMGWGKGYMGMQRGYVPAVLRRADELRGAPRVWAVLLAPLYCMRLVAAPWRTLALSWGFVGLILLLVMLLHVTPAPWREMVDLGVALGLGWGLITLLLRWVRAWAPS